MTIAQLREVSNRALLRVPKDVLLVALVLSVSTFAFGLGMLAQKQLDIGHLGQGRGTFNIESTPVPEGAILGASVAGAVVGAVATEAISQNSNPVATEVTPVKPTTVGKYVASKNGTKYYLATCSGAKRIKNENKVWFASVEDAKASGRTAATNCKGL
jgi:hypothetical protein